MKNVIHSVGTMGGPPPDHDIIVSQHDPEKLRLSPMSVRLNTLEESKLKQLITNAFGGVVTRLSFTFSAIALAIVCTALVLYIRIERVEYAAREANRNARMITDATMQIQNAHLKQLFAAERLHRGEMTASLQQFKHEGTKLEEAIRALRESRLFENSVIDTLAVLESRFQSIMDGMFEVITSLNRFETTANVVKIAQLSRSHDEIMTSLDVLHVQCMEMLVSLEQSASELATRRENESENALRAVRGSLTILTALSFLITITMWFVARQKVSNPIHVLVEEAKTLDTEGLK